MPDSPENARSYEQWQVMTAAATEHKCLFCQLDLSRNKPLDRNGDFDPTGKGGWSLVRVWHNPFPQDYHSWHIMIVPKRHIPSHEFRDLTSEEMVQVLDAWKWAVEFFHIQGGGFVCRFGDREFSAGTIEHLHFQIQVPDLTGPVKATFFKSDTTEDRERRAKRLEPPKQ